MLIFVFLLPGNKWNIKITNISSVYIRNIIKNSCFTIKKIETKGNVELFISHELRSSQFSSQKMNFSSVIRYFVDFSIGEKNDLRDVSGEFFSATRQLGKSGSYRSSQMLVFYPFICCSNSTIAGKIYCEEKMWQSRGMVYRSCAFTNHYSHFFNDNHWNKLKNNTYRVGRMKKMLYYFDII